MKRTAYRDGVVLVPMSMVIGGLLLVASFTATSQLSSSTRMVELVRTRRLLMLAAASATDESCALLQDHLQQLVAKAVADGASISDFRPLSWSAALSNAAAMFGSSGVQISGVQVTTTELRQVDAGARAEGHEVLAMGVAQLEFTVRLSAGGPAAGLRPALRIAGDAGRQVRLRRYVRLEKGPGRNELRAVVSGQNVLAEVTSL